MGEVMGLAEALVGYKGLTLKAILQYLSECVEVGQNGKKTIELSKFEKRIGLPDDFFAICLETKEAPAAATTEALTIYRTGKGSTEMYYT